MTPFEYITVLVSIILGLGVAQIVTGLAHFMHGSNKVKLYWPHLLWIIMIFFFHIQEWWVFYEYKSFTAWQLHTFIFVILYPIGLFIQARLLFPFDNFDEVTDLKKFYYENYRLFFGSVGIQVILSMIDNMWLRKLPLSEQFPQIIIGILMFVVTFFKIRNEWVHKILSILLLCSVVLAIVYNLDTWMIK
jgi:hypothetical protein